LFCSLYGFQSLAKPFGDGVLFLLGNQRFRGVRHVALFTGARPFLQPVPAGLIEQLFYLEPFITKSLSRRVFVHFIPRFDIARS
jgi:hypothetical protein